MQGVCSEGRSVFTMGDLGKLESDEKRDSIKAESEDTKEKG